MKVESLKAANLTKVTRSLRERNQWPAVDLGRERLLHVQSGGGYINSLGATVHILVIDDDVDGADALAALLTQSGHVVEVAYQGSQALGLSFAAEAAIIDLTMPGMDGFEVARRLRHAYGASLRLIAFSGHDDDVTRRLVQIDFDGYLRKPASIADISKALQR